MIGGNDVNLLSADWLNHGNPGFPRSENDLHIPAFMMGSQIYVNLV